MTGASECVEESEEELGDESLARFLPLDPLIQYTIRASSIMKPRTSLTSDVPFAMSFWCSIFRRMCPHYSAMSVRLKRVFLGWIAWKQVGCSRSLSSKLELCCPDQIWTT
jgi:hypothetical protein